MSDYRIGTGGWGYFTIPGTDPLAAYAKAFDFVEVNSTFYQTPSPKTVGSWAARVPANFRFSVKCHRDLTHRYMLRPTEQACQILEEGIGICRRLNSKLLIIQTPPSYNPNMALEGIRDLLFSVSFDDIRLVWEIRWGLPGEKLVKLMQDCNVVHCVDISKEEGPICDSDILYSRLFGHGWHTLYQFDDDELQQIDAKVQISGAKSIYLSFHGGRMYKDAARLKVYTKEGTFPRVTNLTGVEALREVLMEDARFPASREELIETQGWKVIDVAGNRRVHARVLLEQLNGGVYGSMEEVVKVLQR